MTQDTGYVRFAAEAILQRLQAFGQIIPDALATPTVKQVHDMRVAGRRLQAALQLFEDDLPARKVAKWQKRLRRVERALGTARDVDVQLACVAGLLDALKGADAAAQRRRPGLLRLRLRLLQRRAALGLKTLQVLGKWRASETAEHMAAALHQLLARLETDAPDDDAPPLFRHACAVTAERLAKVLAYASSVERPDDVAGLHEMRMAARRLRYTIEIFAPVYDDGLRHALEALRKLQDLLGEVHDADVWLEQLPAFTAAERTRTLRYFGHARPFARLEPGLQALAANRQQHRQERYRQLVTFWQRTEQQALWSVLQLRLGEALT